MQTITRVVTIIGMAVSLGIAMPAYAESAPVYDADSMPQQFDGSPDQGQADFPPPPGSQEQAFVPVQSQPQAMQANTPSGPMTMEQRVRHMEQQINNMLGNDLSTRVDSLQD